MTGKKKYCLALFILLISLARLINLDADPSFLQRTGDIEDGPVWAYQAKTKALYGEWIADDYSQTTAVAPLYGIFAYLTFKASGVSLFSVRLLSVVFSLACILLLYSLVKRCAPPLAVMAAFFFALDHAFFMHSRLGQLDIIILAFLLLSFLCFMATQLGPWRFLLGGLSFAVACGTKFTAVYFLPVFPLYFFCLLVRKEIGWKEVSLFALGVLMLVVPFVVVYFLPTLPQFKTTLIAMASPQPGLLKSLSRLLAFVDNNYFALPSVYLLAILSVLSLQRCAISLSSNVLGAIRSMNALTLIAVTWFLGYAVGIAFSDMADRRYLLFTVPLVCLASLLFEKREGAPRPVRLNGIFFLVICLPVLHYVSYLPDLFGKFGLTPAVPWRGIALLLLAVVFLAFWWLKRRGPAIRASIPPVVIQLSLFCLLFALTRNLIANRTYFLDEDFGINTHFLLDALVALGITVPLLIGMRRSPAVVMKASVVGFILISFSLNIGSVVLPDFATVRAATKIAALCPPHSWVVGDGAIFDLTINSTLRPFFWLPNDRHLKIINADAIQKIRPACFLRRRPRQFERSTILPGQIPASLSYLETFNIWTAFGIPRMTVDLYRLHDYTGVDVGEVTQ